MQSPASRSTVIRLCSSTLRISAASSQKCAKKPTHGFRCYAVNKLPPSYRKRLLEAHERYIFEQQPRDLPLEENDEDCNGFADVVERSGGGKGGNAERSKEECLDEHGDEGFEKVLNGDDGGDDGSGNYG